MRERRHLGWVVTIPTGGRKTEVPSSGTAVSSGTDNRCSIHMRDDMESGPRTALLKRG